MRSPDPGEVVDDPAIVTEVRTRTSRIALRRADGRYLLTRISGWVALPAESSSHLSRANAAALPEAYRILGADRVYAVEMEGLSGVPPVLQFDTSESAFRRFNWLCGGFAYALLPLDFSSLVVCTTDDYLVVAGEPQFVRVALAMDEEQAFAAFRRYASQEISIRSFLDSVLQSLASDYARAPIGAAVLVPR